MIRAAYLGNFAPSFSTESHVALSLEALGHQVTRIQEGEAQATEIPELVRGHDVFLWTRTARLAYASGTREEQHQMLAAIKAFRIPTVGFHLDRWWGLGREREVAVEPFFRVDHLFTADGGHQDQWARAGVNHSWSPPAVFHGEAVDGRPRRKYRAEIIFVGSWRHYGHREWWRKRKALLDGLRFYFADRVQFWPQRGQIRGLDLNALFASAKIVVGDSCLAGSSSRYWSDRVPETLGRGGFLLHPRVEGIEEFFTDGEHLGLYEVGQHEELAHLIDHYLANDEERETTRAAGAAHVRANHTYRDRMTTVLEAVL